MNPAIRVENLSKQYWLSAGPQQGYSTMREALMELLSAPLKRFGALRNNGVEEANGFSALKDLSFDVEQGEIIGIIGRNGAGKSTLLKILSRIVEPTQGCAEIRGRIGSLLEVGTGFHPELTGRENVFLNGAILGMSRREIHQKFDRIVAFAEVEPFLDMPVKRYSSGMYIRLAFAVAAHLEPEILIVDEVLAVGDATYQRKCVSRMQELAHGGRIILFVSHNMDLIPRLCKHAILLERGRLIDMGPAQQVIARYLESLAEPTGSDLHRARHTGDGRARFTHVRLGGVNGNATATHRSGDDLALSMDIHSRGFVRDAALAINLRTLSGTKIYSAWTKEQNVTLDLQPGTQTVECTFKQVRFRPSFTMEVEVWMESDGLMDHVIEALRIPVVDGKDTAEFSNSLDQGAVLTPVEWRIGDAEPHKANDTAQSLCEKTFAG